jgi:hypothetical protein
MYLFHVLEKRKIKPKIGARIPMMKVAEAQDKLDINPESVEKRGMTVVEPWLLPQTYDSLTFKQKRERRSRKKNHEKVKCNVVYFPSIFKFSATVWFGADVNDTCYFIFIEDSSTRTNVVRKEMHVIEMMRNRIHIMATGDQNNRAVIVTLDVGQKLDTCTRLFYDASWCSSCWDGTSTTVVNNTLHTLLYLVYISFSHVKGVTVDCRELRFQCLLYGSFVFCNLILPKGSIHHGLSSL